MNATDGVAELGKAIRAAFISPNVPDSNLEDANLVDVLQRCATGLHRIGAALERIAEKERSK